MSETITPKSMAILQATLRWRSEFADHEETYYVPLNVWRELELLPPPLAARLHGEKAGATYTRSFPAGTLVPPYKEADLVELPLTSFAQGRKSPRRGRYYPRAQLLGHSDIYVPFRCLEVNKATFMADFNHPLASRPLELTITVLAVEKKRSDTGGVCHDWLAIICDGPGMQVRCSSQPTDFLADAPFARLDEREDTLFYETPRLVNHIDAQADAIIRQLYGRLIPPDSRVLDLMSSWNSHLPEELPLAAVTGLGLNEAELAHNPRLTDYVIHDLNRNPGLPFEAHAFDAVICTVSVEYLTRPLEVFADVARVLRPGGLFIVTFSHRWFPPKVIKVWTEILEWERPGLVLEYFLLSEAFDHLQTFSARGWPRPQEDRYYPMLTQADPIYAVWGQSKS